MDNEIENEGGGITIGHIFRTIFSQKWLALIIAAAITLVGTLGLYFMGKRSEVYSLSFVSKIPGSESSPQEFVFPDGKEFRYETMISYDNLEKTKSSNEMFSGIDIKTMYEKGDISVSRTLTETVEGSKEYEATYVITAKSKYFDTKVVARDFLSELTQFPNQYLAEMQIDYDRSLEASRSAIQYDKQLDYLNEQVYFLNNEYAKFISAYSGNFVVKDGKTLNFYQAQLQTFLDRGDIGRLKNKAIEQHFVKSGENGQPLEAALAKYEADKFEKTREKTRIEAALKDALERVNGSSDESSSAQTGSVILDADSIIKYTERIAQLDQDLEDIGYFINENQTDADFDKEVADVEVQVEAFTKDFADISSTVYKTKTTVNYLNTSIIKVEGGRGLIMSGGISLVAGLVVACIAAYIVGWTKERKLKPAETVSGFPVYSEAQLQAAATDETSDGEDTKKDK